jgi:hypothetical protein
MVWGDGAPAIGTAIGASSIANQLMLDLAAPAPNAGVAQSNVQASQAESGSQSTPAVSGGIPAPATH